VVTIIESGTTNEIFNVAGGFEQKNKDTVRKVIGCYFSDIEDWEDHIDLSHVRPGQDVRYSLDDTKLRKLGWNPKKKFDDEIADTVQHYKNNFKW